MNPVIELIDSFFLNPHINKGTTGRFSILYLMRRDALTCFGFDANSGQRIEFKALFPAAMVVLAGVDLLSKLFAGDDSNGNAGNRFKNFLKEYFVSIHSKDDAEIIYQLRNALLHSFGMYSNKFEFSLTAAGGPLIIKGGMDVIQIDYFTLYNELETAIGKYENDVRTQPNLHTNFLTMINKYGFLNIV